MSTDISLSDFQVFDSQALLDWYDVNGRDLPWRRRLPEMAPAYHVFLSELMLQQTVVATVIPYFEKFISLWPDIIALANADLDEVLSCWAGLGYYARARNMHKAAGVIRDQYNGVFPDGYDELLALPGIGPYTAGAIRCFAFNKPAPVLDGNIERVLIRFGGLGHPAATIKSMLKSAFTIVAPETRYADFPQAMMDIGASVCQPRMAHCDVCPLAVGCQARIEGQPERLPVRPAKKQKPVRKGKAYVIRNEAGQFVMYRRPLRGLLGGMAVFPATGWDKSEMLPASVMPLISSGGITLEGTIRHVFTHFTAELDVYKMSLCSSVPLGSDIFWADDIPENWPKLMQKCRAVIST